MEHVAVARGCSCEFSTAVGATRLSRLAGLFPLVTQQIAESRELASVTAVLPASGLRSAGCHRRRGRLLGGSRCGTCWHIVDQPTFLAPGYRGRRRLILSQTSTGFVSTAIDLSYQRRKRTQSHCCQGIRGCSRAIRCTTAVYCYVSIVRSSQAKKESTYSGC